MGDEAAIRISNLRVTAQGLRSRLLEPPEGEDQVVLDDVSLEAAKGSVLAILGESGGGKSTLLRCVNRMVEAEQGSVEVLGRDVKQWEVRELRHTAIYVPQRSFLFGGSVREELIHPLRWNGRGPIKMPFGEVLQAVGLEVDQKQPASELSEGQRHRLCIARALLLFPKILLLDEPTGSLDVRTAREMLAALLAWAKEREVTLVCVTHRPEDLDALGGDALMLLEGKVAGRYPARDVLSGKVDADTSAFLGSPSGSKP
ncbi:MAG: ATP-binding cassette domain-containing protein [Planctomycetes bacterium]|nr:ATP-binding cassette domain-containing protein [Planctomycetota bacterium]